MIRTAIEYIPTPASSISRWSKVDASGTAAPVTNSCFFISMDVRQNWDPKDTFAFCFPTWANQANVLVINLDKFPYTIGSRDLERATSLARTNLNCSSTVVHDIFHRRSWKVPIACPYIVEDDQDSFVKSPLFIWNPYQVQVKFGSIASRYGEYMRLEDTSNTHERMPRILYVIYSIYLIANSKDYPRNRKRNGKESLQGFLGGASFNVTNCWGADWHHVYQVLLPGGRSSYQNWRYFVPFANWNIFPIYPTFWRGKTQIQVVSLKIW